MQLTWQKVSSVSSLLAYSRPCALNCGFLDLCLARPTLVNARPSAVKGGGRGRRGRDGVQRAGRTITHVRCPNYCLDVLSRISMYVRR